MSVLCHTIYLHVSLHIIKETLNPPAGGQGDVHFMIHDGYTKKL